MTARLVVLASGGGTNCQAVLDACQSGALDAQVVAVITNRRDAGVVDRAEQAGVPWNYVEHHGQSRAERDAGDQRLITAVAAFEPTLVVLAGWMRILGAAVGAAFPIMNLHPAKPGEFAGTDAISRAFDAWQAGAIAESGVMVHWVPDEGVDTGPVIATATVPFIDDDDIDAFEARMHDAEHQLIVQGVRLALSQLATPSSLRE